MTCEGIKNDKDIRSPIFVIGNPRSGTTLLRIILTSHSHIGIPPEAPFLIKLFYEFGHIKKFDKNQINRFKSRLESEKINLGKRWNVKIDDLFQPIEDFLDKSYSDVCANIYIKFQEVRGLKKVKIWGDKNNPYGKYLSELNYLYPSARFIHIVRDGRAVFNSYKELDEKEEHEYKPVLSREAHLVAQQWCEYVTMVDSQLKSIAPERHVTVRYEDIVTNFDKTIRDLCDFLGVEYEQSMRYFDKYNREQELEPTEYSWKKNTLLPIQLDKPDLWRKSLSKHQCYVFQQIAAGPLINYGYITRRELDLKHNGLAKMFRLVKVSQIKQIIRNLRFYMFKVKIFVTR